MKKGLLYILMLVCCGGFFAGCIKNGTDRTIEPNMYATLGSTSFSANYVVPSTLTPQLTKDSTTLIVTGTDDATGNKIMVAVLNFKGTAGTYSIVDHKAAATLTLSSGDDNASSGVVAIKEVAANTITGYFSFVTNTGATVTNGTFVVGKPWVY